MVKILGFDFVFFHHERNKVSSVCFIPKVSRQQVCCICLSNCGYETKIVSLHRGRSADRLLKRPDILSSHQYAETQLAIRLKSILLFPGNIHFFKLI